jgi:CBS domain containing-hemolysin-like protein
MTVFVPIAVVLIVLCLAGNFVMSLAEASLLAVSRHEMNRAARRGDRAARLVLEITERSDFVNVAIVGATVLNLAMANLMTQVVRHYVGPRTGLVGALPHVAMLAVILVLAELWPKTYGSMRAGPSARAMAGVMHRLIRLLAPMVSAMNWVSNGVMRLFGLGTEYHRSFATPGEIQAAVDMGEEEGIVEPAGGKMLDNVIELSEQTVKDVMVARVDIMAAPESMSVEEIVPLAIESGFSRIPVYADSIDHITGVVYVNDKGWSRSRTSSRSWWATSRTNTIRWMRTS